MQTKLFLRVVVFLWVICFGQSLHAQRQMEKLGRGIIAIRTSTTAVYVGWRLLGNDPEGIAFNVYRSANGATPVKINTANSGAAVSATTDFTDTSLTATNLNTIAYTYSVRPVLNGVEVADTWANPLSGPFTLPINATTRQYFPVKMTPTPDDAITGVSYDVKFCWVGDFDGDGEYDFLVDRTNPNVEAKQWLQAYKRDGTLLWQMDMGPNSVNHYNITPGSSSIGIGHGDNVTVYDLDGDGKAEVIVRTANGVVFANGTTLTAPDNEVQYISIIDGLSGTEKARATVPIPASWPTKTHVNGQMGIVYADGMKPSIFFHPSNRNPDSSFNKCAITWDYRNGALTQRWVWLESGHTAEGHQVRFADVDNDGRDKYVDIGNVVKADGSGQINENVLTEVIHGDRFHVTDIDPDRPGLETFLIQQNNGTGLATVYHSADKSKVIKKWYAGGVVDVGRGTVGGFVPGLQGLQFFSTQPGVFDAKGNQIYASGPFPPETIWWDADLGREFISTIGSSATSPGIDKFNTTNGGTGRVLSLYSDPLAPNSPYNNYIAYGGRPQFWGDILGDWREEMLCAASDNSELRIYSTKNADTAKSFNGTPFRIYNLMQNPQYRVQATTKGYVQSSYVDYYLGYNMPPPPPPPMVDAKLVWRGGTGATTWDAGTTNSWLNSTTNSTYTDGDTVRFDISGNNATTVALNGTLQPGAVTVYNPKDYTFDGTSGSIAGTTPLTKAGAGTLTLSGNHSFSGKTTVWDGALIVNGDLQQSPVTVWGGTWGGALAAGKTGGRIGGTGRFSQPVWVRYRGTVTPGTSMNNVGTTTFGSGLTAEGGATFALDLTDDPTGITKPNDRIAVTGNLALSGTVNIVINAVNNKLTAGTYTLLTYTGTLTGSVSNLAVTLPAGIPYTVAAGSGAVTLTVPVTRDVASVVWNGGVTGNKWDIAASQNWLRSSAADVFVAGDTVTFDATGAANPTVTLATVLPVAGVTVNSATDYTFTGTGSISGTGGLSKSGTGTLTISTTNDYTGATTVTGGVLAVDNLNDGGVASSIGAASTAASNLTVSGGGTLRLTGSQTNTNRSLTIGSGGAIFDIPTASASMQISGVATGTGSLTKNGAGTLILASANTYSGNTILNAGTIYLAGSTPNVSGLGTGGTITINNGTLTMSDVQASETAAWNLVVPTGAVARLNTDGRCFLTGSLTGAGNFTVWTGYVRTDFKGNWSAFTGQINMVTDSGGDFRITNTAGYGNASLDLGAAVNTYYNQTLVANLTIPIGALSGADTSLLLGGSTSGKTVTYQIGAKNTDTIFAGTIAEQGTGASPVAIQKVGTGTWTLSGASTYLGATTVSAGSLLVNGTLGNTPVTVLSGAALGGTGTISGSVEVKTGGRLIMPANTTSTLTVGGTLTLGGTITILPNSANTTPPIGIYNLITGTGTINNTATFVWGGATVPGINITFDNANRQMIVTAVSTSLTWTGAASAIWDTGAINWIGADTVNQAFSPGSNVTFDDTTTTPLVTTSGTINPASITVNRSATDLTINGVLTDTTPLTPATTLLKSGTGNLTLTAPNAAIACTTNSTTAVVLVTANTTLIPGMFVTGSGITAGTTIASVTDSTHITLSQTATTSVTGTTLNFYSPPSTYGGGTTIQGGTIFLGGGTSYGQNAIGTGKITFTGGTLTLNGYTGSSTPTLGTLTNDLEVPAGMTGRLNMQQRGDVTSKLTGSGTLTLGVTYVRGNLTGDWSAFAGKINVVNDGTATDDFRINSNTGFPNAAINLASGVQAYCRVAGSTLVIGELSGASGSTILTNSGSAAGQAAIWSVGGLNTDATFAGIIREGASIIKTGTGTWTLSGINAYTGTTTVNAGTLKINGNQTTATGNVTIASGATLSGIGTVGGATTIQGRLTPGDPLGTLSFAKTLTFGSTSSMNFTLGTTSDQVAVTGVLTLAGTLNVTAGTGFGPGTYTLFTYNATQTGAITLGTLPTGYIYAINTATAGQIRLVVSLPTFAEWQMLSFGSTTASNSLAIADPDGDGQNNYAEFLAGTNPNSSASFLRMTATSADSGSFSLTWSSVPGKTYTIESATDPAASWQTLTTVTAAPDPAITTSFTDSSSTGSRKFYRVKIISP